MVYAMYFCICRYSESVKQARQFVRLKNISLVAVPLVQNAVTLYILLMHPGDKSVYVNP